MITSLPDGRSSCLITSLKGVSRAISGLRFNIAFQKRIFSLIPLTDGVRAWSFRAVFRPVEISSLLGMDPAFGIDFRGQFLCRLPFEGDA